MFALFFHSFFFPEEVWWWWKGLPEPEAKHIAVKGKKKKILYSSFQNSSSSTFPVQ